MVTGIGLNPSDGTCLYFDHELPKTKGQEMVSDDFICVLHIQSYLIFFLLFYVCPLVVE